MDYSTMLQALQDKAEAETERTIALKRKHPRKYAGLKDKGAFWQSLAHQLAGYLDGKPNGTMPFSEKQAAWVGKCFPDKGIAFYSWWNEQRRSKGLWANHLPWCKCQRGLGMDATGVIYCRDCGSELGLFVPDIEVDPVYRATCQELPDTIDLDNVELWEEEGTIL